MVRELKKNEIMDFIRFGDSLYRNDSNYVPFIRNELKNTIRKLVFETGKYKALCSFDETGKMNGRILLTIKASKQLNSERCGFFSHFEIVDSQPIFNELMSASIQVLRDLGAEYIVGSFFPHDADNRRGILIQGFEYPQMLFASHNPYYYKELFENGGFLKLTDAYEYSYHENPEIIRIIKEKAQYAVKENNIHIDMLNLKKIDRDIDDAHTIMESATTQVNFEKVLSGEEFRNMFSQWKKYIDPEFAFIARTNGENRPVGFALAIPDYFELIRKTNGRLDPKGLFIILTQKHKIKGLRAILQYIIPEYQHKGVSKALYSEMKKAYDRRQITNLSLGTIMENNNSSNGSMTSLGGKLSRIYRIFYKEISY